jgi:Phage integrase family
MRHSHASNLLSSGVPIAVVSQRLGHRDQNITLSIYSHALPGRHEGSRKDLERCYGGRYCGRPETCAGTRVSKCFARGMLILQ